jgi:MFS family permease
LSRLVGVVRRNAGFRRGILWAFAAILVCYLGFALSPGLFVAAGFLAVANAGGSILWTYGAALLQQIVPDSVRGRVAATHMGAMTLAMSTSTFLVGFLLDRGIAPRGAHGRLRPRRRRPHRLLARRPAGVRGGGEVRRRG